MNLSSSLPPGPKSSFWQPVAYARFPYQFLPKVHARHGDPFTVRIPMLTVMTGHPEGVRQIFTAPAETFQVVLPKSIQRVLGAQDLRALGGEAHHCARKLISPGFHGENLKGIGAMVHATTVEALEGWCDGEVRDVLDAMQDVTLDVILKTVFGVERRERFGPLRAAVEELAAAFGSPGFMLSVACGIERDSWPANRRVDAARARLAGLLLEDIAERRAVGGERRDILGRLMEAQFDDGSGFTDAGLVDSLLTNLLAGRAGTSTLLAWVFAWLGRHPEAAERAQREIDGLERDDDTAAILALPYLDALFKECLRLYPQLPGVTRTLAQPLAVRGYEVPAGANVAACSAVLHMDPELYPQPERFRPERFLERSYTGFEFIPFGGGYKLCVGNHFAMLQVKVMLVALLARGRFTLLDQGLVRVAHRGLLMGPAIVRVRFQRK